MFCIASLRFWLPFLCMAVVETCCFNARLLWILTSGSMWWSCTRTGKVEEVGDGYDVVKVRWATLDRHKGNKHGVPSKAFGMPSRWGSFKLFGWFTNNSLWGMCFTTLIWVPNIPSAEVYPWRDAAIFLGPCLESQLGKIHGPRSMTHMDPYGHAWYDFNKPIHPLFDHRIRERWFGATSTTAKWSRRTVLRSLGFHEPTGISWLQESLRGEFYVIQPGSSVGSLAHHRMWVANTWVGEELDDLFTLVWSFCTWILQAYIFASLRYNLTEECKTELYTTFTYYISLYILVIWYSELLSELLSQIYIIFWWSEKYLFFQAILIDRNVSTTFPSMIDIVLVFTQNLSNLTKIMS